MANELVIGRVRTAHGVRGELKVEPLSRETRHFRGLREVTMIRGDRRERVEIESVREAHRVVLVKLVGVDSPEEAKKWRGWEMAVPRELAAPLQEDEYYFADLVGLRVIFESSDVGVVRDLWEGGETVLLGVELPDGNQRLVPFQSAFVAAVNLDEGTLELATREVVE